MNKSYPSPLSNDQSGDWLLLDGQVTPDQPVKNEEQFQGNLLPAIFVGIYFLSIFPLPFWPIQNLRWYFALGLALFAFLAQKESINPRAAKIFWVMAGLNFCGALLSLIRTTNFDLALWNTVGLGISLFTFLLFLPILATHLGRKILFIVLIGTSVLWAFEIQRMLMTFGRLSFSSYKLVEWNKNNVGSLLSFAAGALFYLALFWSPSGNSRKWPATTEFMVRVGFGVAGFYLLYCILAIYDRSSVLILLVGFAGLVLLFLYRSSKKWLRLFQILIIISVVVVIIALFLPKFLLILPDWNRLSYFNSQGLRVINTYEIRRVLIMKAIFLISENPWLGVGIGGTRAAVSSTNSDYPYFYIHNVYLTEWAEKGLLAILSYIILLATYLKFLWLKFFKLSIVDQVWLLIIALVFISGYFDDSNTTLIFILTLFSGIYYEQYQKDQSKMTSASNQSEGV